MPDTLRLPTKPAYLVVAAVAAVAVAGLLVACRQTSGTAEETETPAPSVVSPPGQATAGKEREVAGEEQSAIDRPQDAAEAERVVEPTLEEIPSAAPEASERQTQPDRLALARADEALGQLNAARAAALEAKASDLAPTVLEAARAAEATAVSLYEAAAYEQAMAKLLEAAEAYRRAETRAGEEAELSAEQDRRRAEADAARQGYERARRQALEAGAETSAPDLLRQAVAPASEARAEFERGDFPEAKRDFELASRALQNALAAIAAEAEAALQEMEAARRGVLGDVTEAGAEARVARNLERQGRLAEATAAYRRAASLYEEAARRESAASRVEADRRAVAAVLQGYEAALESEDLAALKELWPDLSESEENQLREFFTFARSVQVDLESTDFQFSGNTATVTCTRRDQIVTVDGERVESVTSATFTFRRSGGSWLIESIR